MKLQDIHIRDPFILPLAADRRYYLYGTTDTDPWFGRGEGFRVWYSDNLEDWAGGDFAFVPDEDFWAHQKFWAPEVAYFGGKYYMTATFTSDEGLRAVQILQADSPLGPFLPHDKPITPADWMCLDGTLHIEDGTIWLIFCHEWTQISDGAICAMRLDAALRRVEEGPIVLFHASGAPWTIAETGNVITKAGDNYVTDGPFLLRTKDGALKMIWSSYAKRGEEGYAIGCATSKSGHVLGPWEHDPKPIYANGGGHGMIFLSFEGEYKLVLHAPNEAPRERAVIVDIEL